MAAILLVTRLSVNHSTWYTFVMAAKGNPSLDDEFQGPLSAPRLSDLIAEQITWKIKEGSLKPGDRLPTEHELARQLGVGRTSVREGLQKLRTLGVVDVRKGLGAYVATGREDDHPLTQFVRWASTHMTALEELAEARMALEALAAALAAVRATDDEVAAIAAHHQAHADAAERDDTAALIHADEAFHEAIMAAGRNHFVRRMYGLLIGQLAEFRHRTLALPWAPARSVEGHAAIAEAIRRGDPAAARAAMTDHLWVV